MLCKFVCKFWMLTHYLLSFSRLLLISTQALELVASQGLEPRTQGL